MKQPRPRTIGAFFPVSVPKPLGAAIALGMAGWVTSVPASLRQSNHLDRRGVHSAKVEIHINHIRGVRNFDGRPTSLRLEPEFWDYLREIAFVKQVAISTLISAINQQKEKHVP